MVSNPGRSRRISLHGGHSGQFCNHAQDSLEDVIRAYIDAGFRWVGISEHMPPVSDAYLYPDEMAAGLCARDLSNRFGRYMTTCRDLKEKYASTIKILVGFETETYSGAIPLARRLQALWRPDYLVGSVHHVDDINFDGGPAEYQQAVDAAGGIDNLYGRYFDAQYDMITALKPAVVGHFDLIRIYDPDYPKWLVQPEIETRVLRNLSAVKAHGLILDLNLRALSKGAQEPYPARSILSKALEMGITVVPGDDSHGVDTVGGHMETGLRILDELGFDTHWQPIAEALQRPTPQAT
ncbi:MAG: histidinol-phosphatase [Deltaproteobacteria bacterium]|nr:histidinol-phosphatase [Deltaproteobacteria bacterium]